MAYKEVNFKSKLLEWSQKNRVNLEFRQLEQTVDENNSPIFVFQVVIEGVEGSSGKGYSKKESQQLASKETLQRLRKEPQYIEAIFAAKADRTKMEEEPVSVPDEIVDERTDQPTNTRQQAETSQDEFSLDDITVKPREKTREEIIAEAEEAAFRNS